MTALACITLEASAACTDSRSAADEIGALTAAQGFKISRDDALGIYKATLKSYTTDGTISRELQEKIVGFQKKQLKIEKDIGPDQVYDFTLSGAAIADVKKAGQDR